MSLLNQPAASVLPFLLESKAVHSKNPTLLDEIIENGNNISMHLSNAKIPKLEPTDNRKRVLRMCCKALMIGFMFRR